MMRIALLTLSLVTTTGCLVGVKVNTDDDNDRMEDTDRTDTDVEETDAVDTDVEETDVDTDVDTDA